MSLRICLWFEDQAEAAATYYASVFRDGRVEEVRRMDDGSVVLASFEIEGQPFLALNGNSDERAFNGAVSFYVERDTQEELDALWDELTSNGGEPGRCGWLVDRFGVSWQLIPSNLPELLSTPEAFEAMTRMGKLDIAELERASGLATH